MKKPWTKSELSILKKWYSEKGAKYVSKRTGHPLSSVVMRAKTLGVSSGAVRRWNLFEKNYILKNYPAKSIESIARTLKRSPASVTNKTRQLKIFVPKPKKWNSKKRWLLKTLWTDKNYSIAEVAAKLNKTTCAVHYKAFKMGLRRPEVWRFWTKEQVTYLKKNYKKKTYAKIASELGMTRTAVFQKARRMGLRHRGTPRAWTADEDRYLTDNYRKIPTRDIAEKLGRSLDNVINRAGPLGISRKKSK